MDLNPIRQKIVGVLPAIPTPLTKDRNVDVGGLQKVIRHVIRGGAHGLWVLGFTSEFAALSPEERKLIVEVAVREANERVPVLVGIAGNDIRAVIRNAQEAQRAGADACFVTLPYYFVVDTAEGIRFIRQVAEASPLPIIIYDIPYIAKTKLDVSAYLELSRCPNIVALKDSTGDFARFQTLVVKLARGAGWKLLQGDERLLGVSLLCGGHGAVLALANLVPALFVKLYEAVSAGNVQETLRLQEKVFALFKLIEWTGQLTDGAFFAALKAGLQVLGLCGNTVSAPFAAMPVDKIRAVEKLLNEFKEYL